MDRGNLEAGFWLLHEAIGVNPHDARTVLAFWDVAVACGRAEAASEAMGRLIHRQAVTGELHVAADHWIVLVKEVPDARLDAASLVRIVPELRRRMEGAGDEEAREDARHWLLSAIRHGVDPCTEALTPGLALRFFEEARSLDPESARRAVQVALQSPDLDERKRARIQELLHELEAEPAPGSGEVPPRGFRRPEASRPPAIDPVPEESAQAEPEGDAALPGRVVPAQQAIPSPALTVLEATPLEIGERGLLALEVASQRRMRVDYGAIEALAAALVQGLSTEAVMVIDLLFKRSPRAGTKRHVLRLRGDSFDPNELLPRRTEPGDALRSFLTELFERCRAVPLPDPESALGLQPRCFPTLEAYERYVFEGLQSGSASGTR